MSNTIKNPYETTSALVEGRTIKDVDISGSLEVFQGSSPVIHDDNIVIIDGELVYLPTNKCYLQLQATGKMDVLTLDGERRIATFLAGITPVGIKAIYARGSDFTAFTVIE